MAPKVLPWSPGLRTLRIRSSARKPRSGIDAAGEGLADDEGIGRDVLMLVGEDRAGAADPDWISSAMKSTLFFLQMRRPLRDSHQVG